MRTLGICAAILILLLSQSPFSRASNGDAAPDIEIPEEHDFPMALSFPESSASEILETMFTAAGLPLEMDPCVYKRRASISVRGISFKEALSHLAHSLDLVITEEGGVWRASCLDPGSGDSHAEEPMPALPSVAIDLNFTIEKVQGKAKPEIISTPRLVLPRGQRAEISQGGSGLTTMSMTSSGAIVMDGADPDFQITVIFEPEAAPADTLRGIFHVAHLRTGPSGRGNAQLYKLSGKFETVLPVLGGKTELCRLRIPRETWILSVERKQ